MPADIYKALAEPARRAILDALTVRDGQTLFGLCAWLTSDQGYSLTRQAISQHLAVLEEAGLVSTAKRGRSKFHYLNTSPLAEIPRRWPISQNSSGRS